MAKKALESGYYVFFIGGSGARTYKAFIHACAAGAIRLNTVNALLLDADANNPACTESLELHRQYVENRRLLQSAEVKKTESTQAFSCDLRMYPRDQTKPISPLQSGVAHLEEIAENDRNRNRALTWFYTETERKQDLRRGFYAHPNIGCLFFQNFGNNPDMKECLDDIRSDMEAGRDVYVTIVGSVFGGTGAAGIPSVLKVINDYCAGARGGALHFAGVLITPYFSVIRKTRDKNGENNIDIDSRKFFGCTKAALRYYDKFEAYQFERIYLVGQTSLDPVNSQYADGGEGQRNKPHIVELFSAMAIGDFFEGTRRKNRDVSFRLMGQILVPGQKRKIGWNSLDRPFRSLADMLRAQAIMKAEIYPYVDEKSDGKPIGTYQWYKMCRMDDDRNRSDLGVMRNYSDQFLEWMYAIQYKMRGERTDMKERDENISLCGDMIEELASPESENKTDMFDWGAMQEKFHGLVELAQDVVYVVSKVFILLSGLGIKGPLAALGSCGLFIKLFELTEEKS